MSSKIMGGLRGILCAAAFGVVAQQASAAIIFGVDDANNLFNFDSAAPNNIIGGSFITGLQPNEQIIGLDGRPSDNFLYGLSNQSRLYTLNPINGVATPVSLTPFSPALNGNSFGFDFNPVVDLIRLTSDADQNLRLNPGNGVTTSVDGTLAYVALDPNFGANPSIVGSAYTNSVSPAPGSTLLYGIDSVQDVLVLQNPANSGNLSTLGALGVDVSNLVGFDIDGNDSNTAYAAFKVSGESVSSLYTIDLATGLATLVTGSPGTSVILGGLNVRDIAVAPPDGFVIPEPGTLGLATAAFALGLRRRREC